MKKKLCLSIFSFFLAVLMAVVSPAQVIADSTNKQYIKEIRIGYGEDGKEQLKKAGYTVWENLNANDGGNGGAVYLGYITTTHKEEAITDLAVMPMGKDGDRAYSFEAYQKEMEILNEQVDKQLENFDAAIEEFRENLQKPAPYNDYALRAFAMLNMYIEDDTGTPVGELFANGTINEDGEYESFEEETDPEIYHNILMLGNSVAIKAVHTALALGCTETGGLDKDGNEIPGDTFLDRLADSNYTGEYDPSINDDITYLSGCIATFKETLLSAKSTYEYAEAYDGGRVAYLNDLADADEDFQTAVKQLAFIDTVLSIPYGDVNLDGKDYSLFDVMMLPTEAKNLNEPLLDDSLLSLLADSMTPGQIAMSQYVGLASLIEYAKSTTLDKVKGDDGLDHYQLQSVDCYLKELEQIDSVSVYLGVDRSVFCDYKTVAITSQAIRDQTINDGLGILPDYNDGSNSSTNVAKVALLISSAACLVVGTSLLISAARNWGDIKTKIDNWMVISSGTDQYVYSYKNQVGKIINFEGSLSECTKKAEFVAQNSKYYTPVDAAPRDLTAYSVNKPTYTYTTSIGVKVTAVAGALFMAAGIALAIVGFLQKNETPAPPTVTYDDIPRAIIDVKVNNNTSEHLYFPYYAAKLATTEDDAYLTEEDTTKLYGDLNGLNTIEPWLCLYYARDLRLGSPLTPTMLVKAADDRTDSQKKTYLPVHDFFNNELTANNQGYAPFNLNQTSQKKNAPSILVFLKRDLTVNPITATIMENSTLLIAIGTFIAGSGITFAAFWIIAKRKKCTSTVV